MRIRGVEEDEIAREHHGDIQQDSTCREDIQRDTTLTETLEKTWSYLKTDHKDEQDKSEILNKRNDVDRCRHTEMSGDDTCKKDECYAQSDTTKLYLAQ